jgi:hypothetical protein
MALALSLLWQILAVGLFIRLLLIGRRPKNYPPGPPTVPILGNLLQVQTPVSSYGVVSLCLNQMPTSDPHKKFQEWAQTYGPVFSLILGTRCLVVLSSDVAVKDLLDDQSAIFGHRGDHLIGHTILSGGQGMLLMVNVVGSQSLKFY